MSRRSRLSRGRSRRAFARGAGSHKRNRPSRRPMRGGIRI